MNRIKEIYEAIIRYEQNKDINELWYAKQHLEKKIIERLISDGSST